MYDPNIFVGAPKGWQCPVCGAVYSPTTPMCYNCTRKTTTTTTTTVCDDSEYWKKYLKGTICDEMGTASTDDE